MPVKKKATVRQERQEAIAEYRKWLEKNPKATRERRIASFDAFIDSIYLREVVRGMNTLVETVVKQK